MNIFKIKEVFFGLGHLIEDIEDFLEFPMYINQQITDLRNRCERLATDRTSTDKDIEIINRRVELLADHIEKLQGDKGGLNEICKEASNN